MVADVRKQLETMFSVDPKEFNQLVKDGIIVKDVERKYNIGSSTFNYIKHLKESQGTQVMTGPELADLFGFTDRRRIDQLEEIGVVVKIGRGIFDANKSSQNYVKHLKGNTKDAQDAEALYEASFREAIAKAEEKEETVRKLKRINDIEEAQVVPTELLLTFLGPLSGTLGRFLDGLVIDFRREFEDDFNDALEKRVIAQIDMCKKALSDAHKGLITEIDKTQDRLSDARRASEHRPGTTSHE